jgi:hypothetical protein
METVQKILTLLGGLLAGWSLGYGFRDVVTLILEKRRNKRLKKKREKLQKEYSWTSTWQQYKTIITIECAVTDSIDEKEKDRLINHLRSTWEDDGIKVIVKNCE